MCKLMAQTVVHEKLSKACVAVLVSLATGLIGVGQKTEAVGPHVFLMSSQKLLQTRRSIASGERKFAPALTRLETEAGQALAGGTFSIVTKSVTPPSGDKHDYMSQAPYFWADPSKKDGLPYIRRDGERNPEINKISDHRSMDQMVGAVSTLALAYYLRGEERYATKAVEILNAWFLD